MSEGMKLKDIRPDGGMQTLILERRKMIGIGKGLFESNPAGFKKNSRCPLCSSADYSEFGQKGFTRFLRCEECQLVYLENEPKDEIRFGNITTSPAADAAVEAVQVATYDARKVRKFGPILERLLQDADADVPLRILDVGCGSGYFLDLVRERTAWQGVGVEMNAKAVEIGRTRGLEIVQTPMTDFTPDAPFDLAVCVGVMAHIANPADLARDLARVLKPGGTLLVRTPNYEGFEMSMLGMVHYHFDPMECMASYNPVSMESFFDTGDFETIEISTPGLLDVDIIRQHLRVLPETISTGPFETRLLYDESPAMDAVRSEFSRFLAANLMSGLMQGVGRKRFS